MLERLQKIIARAGIASRRHAEKLILSGQVLVNGKVVTELGTKADPAKDKIEAAGRPVEADEDHVYIAMHKPPEVVSTLTDPEGRKTLRNFLRGFPERVYPVGSLDYGASGLVFLTNDGDLTASMLRNWSNLPQTTTSKSRAALRSTNLSDSANKPAPDFAHYASPIPRAGTPPISGTRPASREPRWTCYAARCPRKVILSKKCSAWAWGL